LWVKFIQHQISTADFFITFFASKKAANDGHRAEFSEEELQVCGGPFRWGRKSFMNWVERLSGCGHKLANSDFEFFLVHLFNPRFQLSIEAKAVFVCFVLGDEMLPVGIKPLERCYQ